MPNRFSIPPQAIVWSSDFDLQKVKFDLKTNFADKPMQALWTSTYNDDFTKIGWIYWNLGQGGELLKDCLYKVTPKEGVRIFEVDSESDLQSSRLPKVEKRPFVKRLFGIDKERDTVEGFIDFSTLAKRGYDGLHVTANAARLGHAFGLVDKKTIDSLYCYDCESTVWFNTNWIESIELITNDLRSHLG